MAKKKMIKRCRICGKLTADYAMVKGIWASRRITVCNGCYLDHDGNEELIYDVRPLAGDYEGMSEEQQRAESLFWASGIY